jgi:hypothetical protein
MAQWLISILLVNLLQFYNKIERREDREREFIPMERSATFPVASGRGKAAAVEARKTRGRRNFMADMYERG